MITVPPGHSRMVRIGAAFVVVVAACVSVSGPGSFALLTGPTAASPTASTGQLGPPNLACTWLSGTTLQLAWADTSATFTTGYRYQRSNTSGSGYSTLGTTSSESSTTGSDVPPSPVTTPRYYVTQSTHGVWTSPSSNEVASSGCGGTILGFAGVGTPSAPVCSSSTSATSSQVGTKVGAQALSLDSAGGILYFADSFNTPACIRTLNLTTGAVGWVAGGGASTTCGTTTAAAVSLSSPGGVELDSSGNVYIADTNNNCVRKVATNGTVTAIAGGGSTNCPTSGLASSVKLNHPQGLAADAGGNLYIADTANNCVLKIDSGGNVSKVAGGGGTNCPTSSAGSATKFNQPGGLALDPSGNLIIADASNNCVLSVNTSTGTVTKIGGNGAPSSCATSGTATATGMNPTGVAVNSAGDVFISDTNKSCLRKISGGNVAPIAGTGINGSTGNNGPALVAQISAPSGLAVSPSGDLYVNDANNNTIRRIITP